MSSDRSITVLFPAFNDEGSIAALVEDALKDVLPRLTDDFEVLVVNDGSTDATLERLEELARASSRVRILSHERNRGYGAALRTGFSQASKELIFYTDGDGQYDVKELVALYPLLTAEVDVVNGYKIKRADDLSRRWMGAIYNRLARLLFNLPIRDTDCDFRLLRASAVKQIALTASSGAICVELVCKLRKAGCRFAEFPVNHYARQHGRSQFFTPRRVARTIADLFLLWLRLIVRPRLSHLSHLFLTSRGSRAAPRDALGESGALSRQKIEP